MIFNFRSIDIIKRTKKPNPAIKLPNVTPGTSSLLNHSFRCLMLCHISSIAAKNMIIGPAISFLFTFEYYGSLVDYNSCDVEEDVGCGHSRLRYSSQFSPFV